MHHNKRIRSSHTHGVGIRVPIAMATFVAFSVASIAFSQSVLKPEAENSVSAQLKSFVLPDGYEANLFADETDGVANPVCIRWDSAGRLWVLCTWAYPQLKPIDKPNDKLLILTDTDGDGRADKTTVFADGLNMPTGFALGHGGVYVGEGNDLIHLKDTDGDDKADVRRVVLTGFGTGDTHQNINSLTWSPGGELLFNQGLHAFSRVETPWGIRRLDEFGSWRLRPKRLQLDGFRRTSGGGNPWGIAFGNWGQPFVKGNGYGIYDLLPSMVSAESGGDPRSGFIGRTRIKAMIIEFAESPHLPDDIQGDMLIAGYFARDVNRFKWETDGSAHRVKGQPNLMGTRHRAFRPVDIKIGPDGAIYIADWFNPIIGHYQASLRHPFRDKTHGRIWRITAKGRPLAKAPDLSKMAASELCDRLKSDWRYVRLQAKRRLADLPKNEAIAAITNWVKGLDSNDPALDHHLFEAIGVFEAHEVVNRPLLERLLAAKDYRARAYAARVVGRWHDRLDAPLELLRSSATDEHGRVRLEAIVACSDIRTPESIVVAATATRFPMDRFAIAAFKQTVHALSVHWLPALQKGTLKFDAPKDLIQVLRAYGGKDVAVQVRRLIHSDGLSADGRRPMLELLARVGTPADLKLVFDHATKDAKLLEAMVEVARVTSTRPPNVAGGLSALLGGKDTAARAAAARLAGMWRQKELISTIDTTAKDDDQPDAVRAAAILSFGELVPERSGELRRLITPRAVRPVRLAALQAVSRNKLDEGMHAGLMLISDLTDSDQVAEVLAILMGRKNSADAMVKAMSKSPVKSDDAKRIVRWLNATGITAPKLTMALLARMDVQPGAVIKYSKAHVDQLMKQVKQSGDVAAGRKVFQSSVTGCIACHEIQGVNQLGPNAKGPDLSAAGAGLPTELIIESIIWPKRQIKEGYEASMLMLDDGDVITGYITARNGSTTSIRDMTTNKVVVVSNESIEKTVAMGSVMPEGLTALLTKTELRDLVAYLASLKHAP